MRQDLLTPACKTLQANTLSNQKFLTLLWHSY